MSTTPSVPDGWTTFNTAYGDSVGVGAKKWFGTHYKDVVVDADTGDLFAACAAIDLEAQLRDEATVNAGHTAADALEAEAAALRDAGPDTRTPDPVVEAPLEAAPETPAPPVTVLSDGEVHKDSAADAATEPEQDTVETALEVAAPEADASIPDTPAAA